MGVTATLVMPWWTVLVIAAMMPLSDCIVAKTKTMRCRAITAIPAGVWMLPCLLLHSAICSHNMSFYMAWLKPRTLTYLHHFAHHFFCDCSLRFCSSWLLWNSCTHSTANFCNKDFDPYAGEYMILLSMAAVSWLYAPTTLVTAVLAASLSSYADLKTGCWWSPAHLISICYVSKCVWCAKAPAGSHAHLPVILVKVAVHVWVERLLHLCVSEQVNHAVDACYPLLSHTEQFA